MTPASTEAAATPPGGWGGPGRGSLTWKLMGDARVLLLAPMALVLQVAHPVVGAGVSDHSDFRRDAWGRLSRTMTSVARFTYGDDAVAGAEAARLRAVHDRIRGVDASGQPYRASDPAAMAWVHLTLAHLAIETRRLFGPRLDADDRRRFYAEWRTVGRRLGVDDAEMPPEWGDFEQYFEFMVGSVLEVNDAVLDVLDTTRRPPRPAGWLPQAAWGPLAAGAGGVHAVLTVGCLPPALRDALGVRWTPLDEARLRALAGAVQVAGMALPPGLRHVPQVVPYMVRAWRRSPAAVSERGRP